MTNFYSFNFQVRPLKVTLFSRKLGKFSTHLSKKLSNDFSMHIQNRMKLPQSINKSEGYQISGWRNCCIWTCDAVGFWRNLV